MKTQRIALVVTVINLMLMVVLLAQFRLASANDEVVPILRGRGLEIVDSQGRIRAQILVHGPEVVNNKQYPETVLFRLADQHKRPLVKLTAAENGAALGLSDDADGGVQLFARDTGSFVKVTDKKGKEQVLKP
jgi:hypothetical protein